MNTISPLAWGSDSKLPRANMREPGHVPVQSLLPPAHSSKFPESLLTQRGTQLPVQPEEVRLGQCCCNSLDWSYKALDLWKGMGLSSGGSRSEGHQEGTAHGTAEVFRGCVFL